SVGVFFSEVLVALFSFVACIVVRFVVRFGGTFFAVCFSVIVVLLGVKQNPSRATITLSEALPSIHWLRGGLGKHQAAVRREIDED
ncbi:MAG: hypothetical protein ORN83_16905, partial [Chthoniobacteraceae bacterium]|nr:hypothetical protein [Chthoniobacteraceae bacterium]